MPHDGNPATNVPYLLLKGTLYRTERLCLQFAPLALYTSSLILHLRFDNLINGNLVFLSVRYCDIAVIEQRVGFLVATLSHRRLVP